MHDSLPRILILIGLAIVAVGGLLWLGQLLPPGWRPGHLPGDLIIRRDNFTLYLPMTTMILISLAGSGILLLIRWLGQ
jgi:hypothetical protein